ncbi:MAG: penicillin-binding protein 2 [Endomicrobium sp.]|jgi:cell division protein FtsI (penicillin-binding protein 3)|nr:penicillin-binding protein 2 [Endomicrobium sp.]
MKKYSDRDSLLIFIVLIFFFILFIKLMYLQIILHVKIDRVVKKMVTKNNIENSKRGDILDIKGNILATSVKQYIIFLDSKIIKDLNKIKMILFKYGIKIKEQKITEFKEKSYIPIAYNVNIDIANKIRSQKLEGVGFDVRYTRHHPEGKFLTHILGITDCCGNGLEGIEKKYNKYLLGSKIVTRMYRDGYGHIIMQDKLVDQSKMCGQNVILSIDRNIQFIAEQELRKAFDKYNAKKAICIIQNPKNGGILAMVSLPDFDFSNRIKNLKILRNSAISDVYEPGSTFKIVTIAAALDMGKIKCSDSFYLENGKLKLGGHIIRDNHKINGTVSLSKIMEISSNIGIIKIAQKLVKKEFYDYIKKFGFHSLTGIDLIGESKGILMNLKYWNHLTLPTISFGQGIAVTPIQMLSAFSIIANDGVFKKPYVVQEIRKVNNKITFNILDNQKLGKRVVSYETAQIIKKLLRNVVESGTGKNAKVNGYSVAGKTGTAQKFDHKTKSYSTKFYTVSFCGMLPVINPKLVILVIIDEPKSNNYYAAAVAAPVFANIAKRTAEYLGIKKDKYEIV